MTNKVSSLFGKYFLRIDKRIIGYAVCILIATGLWALNKLNQHYTTELSYPVIYTDIPKDKYLVNDPPDEITIEVSATGFVLLRHQISHSFLPIILSINPPNRQQNNRAAAAQQEYTIRLNDIRDRIAGQLSSSVKLLNINPEEIQLVFSKAASKKVKVIPSATYSLRKGYILKDRIRCTPDSVLITGPSTLLDSITELHTKVWNAGEVNKNTSTKTELLPLRGVYTEIHTVTLSIEAERFTEARKTIPITPENIPDSLRVKLFPDQVEVSYDVGLSRYDAIRTGEFHFTVVYPPENNSGYLQVRADAVPPFVQNLKFSPRKVEFILEKK